VLVLVAFATGGGPGGDDPHAGGVGAGEGCAAKRFQHFAYLESDTVISSRISVGQVQHGGCSATLEVPQATAARYL